MDIPITKTLLMAVLYVVVHPVSPGITAYLKTKNSLEL